MGIKNFFINNMSKQQLLFIIIFIIISTLVYLIINKNNTYFVKNGYNSINTKFDPLYKKTNNYLSLETCNSLSKFLEDHPRNKKNTFSGSFKNTYGLSFSFRQDNLNLLDDFNKYDIEDLYPIVTKIINDISKKSNAYIVNVLIIEPKISNCSNKIVNYHYDDSLDIMSGKKIQLARWITANYLQLPKHFTSGELLIYDIGNKKNYLINPEVGSMVRFRGDSYHGVNKICSDEKTKRISLIIEHYELTPNQLINVPSFTIDI